MTNMEQTLKQIETELSTIFPNVDHFSVMGVGDYNFAMPPNSIILEEQIESVKKIGYKLSQVEYVYQQSGMSDHLHIWIHRIMLWEK